MATYVNDLRLKEIATGDESGTWGTSTNTNLELIAEAFSFGTEAITTNADTHTTTIADGSTDPGRSLYLKYTGTLDSACTITIGPNTVSKLWFIENGTSGSQNIIIKQGSGATITVPPGDTKAIYSDGAGSGGAMVDAFASLSVVDLKVQDDLTVTDDMTVGGTLGVTGIVTLTDDLIIGDGKTIGSASDVDAMTIASNGQVTFTQTLIGTALDISGDIDVDGTTNLDVVDIDGAVDMASTLGVTGVVTANAGVVVDNITIDGTEIDLSSGTLTLDAQDEIHLDADSGIVRIRDGGDDIGMLRNESSDFTIRSMVSDKDMLFKGNDGGSAFTALSLDMSDAGTASFNHDVKIATGTLLVGNSTSGGTGTCQASIGFDAQDGSNTTSIAIRNYSSAANSGSIIVDPDNVGASSVMYFGIDGISPAKIKLDSSGRLNIDQVDTRFGTGALNITGEVGASFNAIQFRHNASTVVGTIVTGASSTTYNTSSDYRLKENVDYTWDATTRLKQLKPARFNFITDDTNTLVDGFLAHEVSSIVPEAITGEKDAMMDEEYEITPAVKGADGIVITEAVMGTHSVPNYQSIDQAKLVPLLVKTIQELEARITALEG
tara:strand:- start:259 stop:2079 length:1821 start_codon:yes stop_codon:yes gene_type:complete